MRIPTDDTRASASDDARSALDILIVLQCEPRVPSDLRAQLADASQYLRGIMRKLSMPGHGKP